MSAVRKPDPLVKAVEEAAGGEPVVVSGWGLAEVSVYYSGSFVNIVGNPPIQSCKLWGIRPVSLLMFYPGFRCNSFLIRMIDS